jgi:phosphatidylglycerophosphatase A
VTIYNFIVKTISTFCYVGYLPFIPGTFGSLAGLFLFYIIRGNKFSCALITLFLVLLGFLVSGQAEKIFQKKDPPVVVIDEVSGMLLSLLFIPFDSRFIILAFILFRLFDALKPYPIDKLQNLKGSLGIMSDDLVAGLYANITLQIIFRLVSFKAS